MNIQNLSSIAAMCRNISEKSFDMRYFRLKGHAAPECKTVGCVLGHATVLETGALPRHGDGQINFEMWSESFTGLGVYSPEWMWCFAAEWAGVDNSPLGAAWRIEWLLEGNEIPAAFKFNAGMVAMYS